MRFHGKTGAFIDTFVVAGSGGLNGPNGLVFGPDGNLYVSSWLTNSVLRYNRKTGAFMGAFVRSGSGSLAEPWGLAFGPDGNLYVTSAQNDRVLRYHGRTGTFLGTFISGSGLARPDWLLFLPLEAPGDLTVVPVSASQIRVSWTDNSDDETGFEIERKTETGPFTRVATVGPDVTSLIDSNLRPNSSYSYRVRAVKETSRSAYSNEAEATLFTGIPLRVGRSLTLPPTFVGGTSAQSLLLQNVGSGSLAGSVESPSPPFTLLSGGGPFILAPGQGLVVVVGCRPSARGPFTGTLAITRTDATQTLVSVALTGEGTAASP